MKILINAKSSLLFKLMTYMPKAEAIPYEPGNGRNEVNAAGNNNTIIQPKAAA
jgi:hypothetical protein